MNYKHGYHAGNFADVIKHVTLLALFASLSRKPTPFCYIDTHAGAGYYDLFSEFASKNKEYAGGIEKLIQQDNPPMLIKRYLDCVHHINNQLSHSRFASLHYYPGSPMIARYIARAHDRIIACELQADEYRSLKSTFNGDKQVAIHHRDGYIGLKAFLPPAEKRGLVLIDPPYEDIDEFNHIARTLPIAIKKWPSGIYAIWCPIKTHLHLQRFYRELMTTIQQPIFTIELTIYPDLPNHLNGCGLIIVNPPWQFDKTMEEILPWLWNALTINHQGGYRSEFLKSM